jgi:hypothetical protein
MKMMENNNRQSWRQDARELDSKDFNGYLTINNMRKSAFQERLEQQAGQRSAFNNQFNKTQRKIKRGFTLSMFITLVAAICWFGNLYRLTQCDLKSMDNPTIVHAIGIIPYASIVTVWFPVSEQNNNNNGDKH